MLKINTKTAYPFLAKSLIDNCLFIGQNIGTTMVEKKAIMSAKEERAHNKKNVTKVDPDDDDTNVHRLVQDENAKTILLNFPLEVSVNEKDVGKAASNKKLSSPRYKFCYKSVL